MKHSSVEDINFLVVFFVMRKYAVAVLLLFLKVNICETENAIIGSTKQLFCQIQNGNSWEKYNDRSVIWEVIDNGERYSGSLSSTLTISNFQIEDSGYYRCKVDETKETGNTMILKPEMQAYIGATVTLTCTVSGAPLYWYLIGNQGAHSLSDSKIYEDSRTSSLKIKYLTTNTAGIYYCQLTNGAKGPDITVSIVGAGWSSWNAWSACSVTCGNGQHQRSRTCLGGNCQGIAIENANCTADYRVDGAWSAWSTSGPCTRSCGGGAQPRLRLCNNPLPENCGVDCLGAKTDYISCSPAACPVNGGWSSWDSWGVCNVTCGTGQQSRRRYCNNPLQANGSADCQGEEDDVILCARSECAEKQSRNIPVVVGTVTGVLFIVILILLLVIYAKRRWYNPKNEPDYETTDMANVKGHIYGETHENHIYQNDKQAAKIEVTVADSYVDGDHLVERYDVSDLTKRYRNKQYFLQRLTDEFKLLTVSTDDPNTLDSQYEIIVPGLRQDVNQLHVNSSTLDVLTTNNVSILLELPQNNLVDQFWTIVDNQCIEIILLLTKGNEKVTEFYPILDDVLRIHNFEIYLESAERTNKNIMLLTFNLQNKTTKSIRQIKMLKVDVSEYPTDQTLCLIVDKASEIRGAPVLLINSKMDDLCVCGVLTVCLNVIYAIKNGRPFSVLENAMVANKNNRRFFKNCDDYELCYKVLEHYLEAVHTCTYDVIE